MAKRKITPEEKKVRDQFIKTIWGYIDTIDNSEEKSPKRKMELLAFSILAMIDGEGVGVPPFEMRPINEKGKTGPDIAGDLHNNFYPF